MIQRLNPSTLFHSPAFTQVISMPNPKTWVYVGGQNGVTIQGELVGDSLAAQSEQGYRNLISALEAAGATLSDVVKLTIYLVEGHVLEEAFEAAMRIVPPNTPPPTITFVYVSGLSNPGCLIEFEAVAALF